MSWATLLLLILLLSGCASTGKAWCGDLPPIYGDDC